MKTIVGLFRDPSAAENSIGALSRLGLTPADVGLLQTTNGHAATPSMQELDLPGIGRVNANASMVAFLRAREARKDGSGVFGMLLRMGIDRRDAAHYVEGIRQGGVFEAFDVTDDREADALAIMRRYASTGADDGGGKLDQRGEAPTEIVIPIIEEELYVGKREIPSGVRVDTRVTSEPVEHTIQLIEEHVEVERRQVDRLLDADTHEHPSGRPDLFADRTVEMALVAEEPFIEKRARVVEEVRIHKDRQERIETIRDSLRHTEVDVRESSGEDGARFDGKRYRDHFERFYAPQKLSFEKVAPAYEFGERLRRRSTNGDWSAVESRISMNWERTNPGTWTRFRDAIRAGWNSVADDR